jgi:hypothetical protein
MADADLTIQTVPQTSPLLGRHLVHDRRSRAFPFEIAVDRSTWRTRNVRVIDPRPNPRQTVGNCTTCAKGMQMNAVGNRRLGQVLGMDWALDAYVWETANDEFPGQWNRDGSGDDTGSSGLASCKTAEHLGIGGDYRWLFGGADEVVQAIMSGEVISVGTWWHNNMFSPDADGRLHLGGGLAGGHQYVARGYDVRRDWVLIRCWWGPEFRDAWLARADLQTLLMDGGDAHWQRRL